MVKIMIEIKLRKNEIIDKALRRFKKKVDRENVLRELRGRRFYEKPSDKKRKMRASKTNRFRLY